VNNTKGAGTLDASDQNALETECAESSKISAITTLEEFAPITIKEPFSSRRRHLLIHYRWTHCLFLPPVTAAFVGLAVERLRDDF
jgi:hypothetical protein